MLRKIKAPQAVSIISSKGAFKRLEYVWKYVYSPFMTLVNYSETTSN